MGSDPIALPLLDYLYDSCSGSVELVGCFTQPDRPTGRGMKVASNGIKRWAMDRNLTIRQPEKCGPTDEQWLREAGVDLILVMAFGQLLRRSLIDIPPRGTINFHASILPKLRGASPIHTAIASGESETGISLMQIVPKLDAGPVLDVERVPILPDAQAPEVIAALAEACVPLIARNLEMLCQGQPRFIPQDESATTYCRRINKEDARLDFACSARALHDHIRAFQPWPGAMLEVGGTLLKIGSARREAAVAPGPGTLVVKAGRAFVQCADDSLELLALQRPGGRMLPTVEFLKGFSLATGAIATSHPMEPLVASKPFSRK